MGSVIKLRPVDPDDEPFLRELQSQLDSDRLGIQFWKSDDGDDMAKKIIDLQFRAHSSHYKFVKNNWETKDNIIEMDGVPVGRFIVAGGPTEIRLCDLAVHKKYRNMGLGQMVIDMTKQECMQSKRPFHLHVDKLSSAYFFYLNLGFRVIETKDTHYFMEWTHNESKTIYSFGKA